MTLATDEFIRRFLMHVLPKGFHRIRHYGLLANGNRAANIAQARELLAVPSRPKQSETPEAAIDEPRVLPRPCPCCGGRMIIIETFARGCDAEAPTHTGSTGDQDRHVMMPSPPIDDRPEARYSCWITAGSAHDRAGLSDWPALAPPIWSCTVRSTGSSPTPTTILRAKAIASTAPVQPPSDQRSRRNPHSACGTAVPYPPRFRALALFGRRPPERVVGIVGAGVRKPYMSGTLSRPFTAAQAAFFLASVLSFVRPRRRLSSAPTVISDADARRGCQGRPSLRHRGALRRFQAAP